MKMSEKWIPPEDMSDIPLEILAQIPEDYYYWMAEDPEELRVALMEAIERGEVVIKSEISVELSTEELEKVYLRKKIELIDLMKKRWSV